MLIRSVCDVKIHRMLTRVSRTGFSTATTHVRRCPTWQSTPHSTNESHMNTSSDSMNKNWADGSTHSTFKQRLLLFGQAISRNTFVYCTPYFMNGPHVHSSKVEHSMFTHTCIQLFFFVSALLCFRAICQFPRLYFWFCSVTQHCFHSQTAPTWVLMLPYAAQIRWRSLHQQNIICFSSTSNSTVL